MQSAKSAWPILHLELMHFISSSLEENSKGPQTNAHLSRVFVYFFFYLHSY